MCVRVWVCEYVCVQGQNMRVKGSGVAWAAALPLCRLCTVELECCCLSSLRAAANAGCLPAAFQYILPANASPPFPSSLHTPRRPLHTDSVYFEQVERDLMAGLDQLMREETWQPLSGDLRVLRSSNELVEALKSEMRDCTGRVTRGKPLLELAAVFQVSEFHNS